MDMSNKLKKLQIKKLIQEYEFLNTEDEYKKEVIDQNKNTFMEKVGETRKKLNLPFPEPKEPNNEEVKNEVSKETKPENVSESTKSKVKKIYREIVKLTHPDRTSSEELVETYRKATIAADNYNILELYEISVELKIPIELDMEDIETLMFLINRKREELKKIDGSFIWLWLNANTEEEKEMVVTMFVKQTSGV
jgi:hypothetical protein